MRILLLLVFFLGKISFGISQNTASQSPITAIYKITDEEAERIFKSPDLQTFDSFFHTLVDTFSTVRYQRNENLNGHYLFIKAVNDELDVVLESFLTISAIPLNNRRDLTIQVIDSLGNIIENAAVFFGKKKLKYDKSIQAFRRKKTNKGGFLKVKANGETIFYQVNDRDKISVFKKRYYRFRSTKIGRVVTTPFRWGGKVWYFFKNGIKGHWWNWDIFRRRKKDKSHRGYIVLNQPKYQPGDTIKIKAYLTNHKGKPLTRDLQLKFYQYYNRPFSTVTISPNSKGNYVHEFVLGDSLKLDQSYGLDFFYKKKKKTKRVMSHYFYYEDYQLGEVDYTFETTKKVYGSDEKIILLAEGKDKNGWTIPDGQIELVATVSRVNKYYEQEVIISDTLWKSTQALDTRGQTQLIFPKENLPATHIQINLEAKFSNSNGELDSKFETIVYDAKKKTKEEIKVTLEDEFIVAKYFVDGKEQTAKANLLLEGDENNIDSEHKIKLPFKERVNPFVLDYDFEIGDVYEYISLEDDENKPNLSAFGKQTKDSIFVNFLNPRRLSITFQLRSKNNLITKDQTDKKTFQLALKSKNQKSVFLYYQYVWAGQSFEQKVPIHFYKNLLSIEVKQPPSVEPGQNVPFKVSVKTAKGQPAKNVNLAAGAINSQFNNLKNIKEPQVKYKPSKSPFEFDTFQLEQKRAVRNKKKITERWYDELQLDTSLYYQMLFPKQGVHMESFAIESKDTFYQDVAQFAPYLVKDGKMEPIYLIYCNRKLVYYYGVDNSPSYSFIGLEGPNQIVIRTRESVYTIGNVMLKKGEKVELSIDVDNYWKSELSKYIFRKPTTKELTIAEKELLKRKIFILKNFYPKEKVFVWQDETNIQSFYGGYKINHYKIGPFYSNKDLRLLVQDNWNNTFQFESGFNYEIQKNRERLYESKFFHFSNKIILPHSTPPKQVGEIVFSPNNIQAKTSFYDRLSQSFFKNTNRKRQSNTGNFIFQYYSDAKKDSSIYAIALIENDSTTSIYNSRVRSFKHLPSKDYTMILFTPQGNYLKKEFTIRANETLFQDWNNNAFTVDTSRALFKEIMLKHSAKKFDKNEVKVLLSEKNNHQSDLPSYGSIEIFGKVTDGDGEPLIGATVIIKGTSNGTTCDVDGNYQLFVPAGYNILVFSYTGYATSEIDKSSATKNNRQINVSLYEGAQLDEIVVTGYGISKERKSLGYSTISSKEIDDLPTRNVNSIKGRVAGITVRGASSIQGSPGSSADYYIDGIRVRGNLLAEIDLTQINLRSDFSDYAYFHPNLITDQNGEAYFNVTFPDNITAWKTYVVGMDNKLRAGTNISEIRAFKKLTAQLALPRFLIEGDETNIIGKSINYTLDSFQVTTVFKIGEKTLKTNQSKLKDALIEKTKITTPKNLDSLTLSYLLSTENYGDGEERSIPVFQKGVKETDGVFKVLDEAKSFGMSVSPRMGKMTIRIEDNVLNALLEDVKYLRDYPYGCNEQTASRLIALLLEKEIKQSLGEEFDGKKEIIKAIRRLKKTQNEDGSWGWWQNGKQNIWMTTYVLNALEKAKQANYKTEALNKGLVFLTNRLEEMQGKNLINTLTLFSDVQQNVNFEKYLIQLDSTPQTLFDKFSLIKIRQAQGLPYSIDSIMQHKKENLFGGWHFGEDNFRWYNNSSNLTLLAYDIFKKEKNEVALKNIRQYFFSRRKSKYGWRNTIFTAKILSAILPDILNGETGLEKNEVKLVGALNTTISKFPFETVIFPTEEKTLNVIKSGNTPIFFTAFQEFWNPEPTKKENIFSIKTHLTQNGKKANHLEAAVAADLVVNVEVKQIAEYVMIEIPIPAGCSYRAKPNNYWNRESHREYFKDRVAIFCEDLPIGEYTFTVPLEPRFSGNYTLNPTKAEQMYFPIFYGRNGMGKVAIK